MTHPFFSNHFKCFKSNIIFLFFSIDFNLTKFPLFISIEIFSHFIKFIFNLLIFSYLIFNCRFLRNSSTIFNKKFGQF